MTRRNEGCATANVSPIGLNDKVFVNLQSARNIIEAWRRDYNSERPHSSLNNMTPNEFATRFKEQQTEITKQELVQSMG